MVDPLVAGLGAVVTAQAAYLFASWKGRQVDVQEVQRFHQAEASEDALGQMTEE